MRVARPSKELFDNWPYGGIIGTVCGIGNQIGTCTMSKNILPRILRINTKKRELVKIRVIRGKKTFGSGLSGLGTCENLVQ
jgi:hypothetical protein